MLDNGPVGYCLKMVQIAISLSLVLYRDCLGLHKLNSKITGIGMSLTVSIQAQQ